MSRPLSAVLAEAHDRVWAIERLPALVRNVLDGLHGRSCPECGRVQYSPDLNEHARICVLGAALAALVAAMPEDPR